MKKILLILAIVLVFLGAGLFYTNKILLPVHVKGLILTSAREQLKGRDITIGTLNYNPLKGIVVTDLLITAKNNPTKAFVQIKEISAQVLLFPLFQKKVIISSLRIEEPVIKLIRIDGATWNFSDLIPVPSATPSDEKPPFEIMVSDLAVVNGQVTLEDGMSETLFTETLSPVNIKGALALSNNLHAAVAFSGDIGITSSKGSLGFNARIGIADKTLKSELHAKNINVEQYLRFIPSGAGMPVLPTINRLGIQNLDMQVLQSQEGLTVSGNGSIPAVDIVQKDVAALQGQIAFNKLYVSVATSGSITAQGNISSKKINVVLPNEQHAQGKLALDLSKLTIDKTTIEGVGSFLGENLDVLIGGIAFSGNVKTTQSTFSLKENVITATSDLDATKTSVSIGKDLQASGDIRIKAASFGLNNNDITASGDLDIKNATLVMGNDLKASGDIHVNAASFSVQNKLMSADGNLQMKNASLSMGKDLRLSGDINIPKASLRPSETGLLLTANADLKNTVVTISPEQTITGDISLQDISCALSGADALINANADMQKLAVITPAAHINTTMTAKNLAIVWKNKALDATAEMRFKELNVAIPKSFTFNGSPTVSLHLKLDPADPAALAYDGKATLNGGQMTDVPTVGNVTGINTDITFKTDQLTINALSLSTMDTPLTISGKVERFSDPYVSLDVKAERINLALAEKFIPDLLKEQGASLNGTASLNAHFTGRPSKPLDAMILARVTLADTNIKSTKLAQEINNIRGLLIYETPKLSWQDLKLTWQERAITLNGTLENFESPLVSGSVKTEELNADFIIEKMVDKIAIKKLKGTCFNSDLDMLGSVELPSGSAPQINVSGTAKIALKDLPQFLPAQAKQIKDLKLGGIVKLTFKAKGKIDDWQNLRTSVTLETPAVYVMGYQVEDLNISSEQKDGELDPLTITAVVYGGNVNATNNITLTDTAFPFESSFKITNLNLEQLKKAIPALSQQQLAGLFSAVGNIKGKALDIQNMTGKSVVSIREGYLWGVEALAGVMKVLASSFQNSGDMTLKEADATLIFNNRKIQTDDLVLKSDAMTIKGKGWIDWDQNIEMSVAPELTTAPSADGTTSLTNLINPTAGLINIRVSGKLSAPKIEHNISAPTMIKKTLQNTVGGLLKLFE